MRHIGSIDRPESDQSEGADHGLESRLRSQDLGTAAPMVDVPDGRGDRAEQDCDGAEPEDPSYQFVFHNCISQDPRMFPNCARTLVACASNRLTAD